MLIARPEKTILFILLGCEEVGDWLVFHCFAVYFAEMYVLWRIFKSVWFFGFRWSFSLVAAVSTIYSHVLICCGFLSSVSVAVASNICWSLAGICGKLDGPFAFRRIFGRFLCCVCKCFLILYNAFGYATVDNVVQSNPLVFFDQMADWFFVELCIWNIFWVVCAM